MLTGAPPKFAHLGIAVSVIQPAIDSYKRLFGYQLLSGPFDDPIQKVTVCFLAARSSSDFSIELVAPLGPGSPIDDALKKGLGAYHVCYEVADLGRTLQDFRNLGCIVISKPVPAAAFGGRRIAWLYTPTRQLVELLESTLPEPPA
jgi:methylmalonyl-CoA/ethylmalonyl-CoA epimerase